VFMGRLERSESQPRSFMSYGGGKIRSASIFLSTGRLQAQGDKVTFADPNHASFAELPNAGRAGVFSDHLSLAT